MDAANEEQLTEQQKSDETNSADAAELPSDTKTDKKEIEKADKLIPREMSENKPPSAADKNKDRATDVTEQEKMVSLKYPGGGKYKQEEILASSHPKLPKKIKAQTQCIAKNFNFLIHLKIKLNCTFKKIYSSMVPYTMTFHGNKNIC